MSRLIVFIYLCSFFVMDFSHSAQAQGRRPNIIFIMADDLGYGDVGVYGQTKIETPRIDKMAGEGMKFYQFYAGTTVCAPSRSALMTGLHTGHTYVRGNGNVPLRPEDVTMPQVLKQGGYSTGMFGKWGLGLQNTTGSPEKKGWDEFLGHMDQTEAHFQYSDSLWQVKNGKLNRVKVDPSAYTNDLFTAAGLNFIKEHQQGPFFLYIALTLPHAELKVPDNSMKKYLDANGNSIFDPEIPFPGAHYGAQPKPRAAYAAMVSRTDEYVGQILDLLAQLGIDKNTLVVFTSDNGPHKEGGHVPAYFQSSGPFRGIKRDMYEGGIRIPMIVRWPGIVKANSVSNEVFAHWDFLPTFAEAAHLKTPAKIDGISFLPTLKGKGKQKEHPYLYWEFHENGFSQAIRQGDWKIVRIWKKGVPPVSELYNLAVDPAETNNLAATEDDRIKSMNALLNEAHAKADHPTFQTLENLK